jgi:hypothetical protein
MNRKCLCPSQTVDGYFCTPAPSPSTTPSL